MSIGKESYADLKQYYVIFFELGLIATLGLLIALFTFNFYGSGKQSKLTVDDQEVVKMEDVIQTRHIEKAPPPPRPVVPVEVPDDEVIEESVIDIDAEINLDEPLTMPAPPKKEETTEDFFVVVEDMPQLIGGLESMQKQIKYPEAAIRASIEGRVIIQFIVNEKGEVENPQIIRGIGGGCDEEALRVVKIAKFEPGRQRGRPVRVQYSLPVIFKLQT